MIKYRNKISKLIILAVFFIILVLPEFQNLTNVFPQKLLSGYFQKSNKPVLVVKTWLNGEYQKNYDTYINDNIGFKGFFIRVFNQVNYSLYKETSTKDVIVGGNKYLYSINNIEQHYGLDTIRKDILIWRAIQLERITDSLKAMGIELITVIVPSKSGYKPEYIPKDFDLNTMVERSNYKIFTENIKEKRVEFIDLTKWFQANKSSAKYNLFSNTGIHWSQYGVCLSADTILKYSQRLKNRNMPKLVYDTIITSKKLQGQDEDIENSMNLLLDIADIPMPYPRIHFDNSLVNNKTKFLCIGDSYFWDFFTLDILKNGFGGGEFWYYFNEVHSHAYAWHKVKDVDKTKFLDEFKKNDIILLLANDANLYYLTRVISEIYEGLFPNRIDKEFEYAEREKKIDDIVENIMKTPEWLESIRNQAKEKKQDLNVLIRDNARFVYETQQEQSKNK